MALVDCVVIGAGQAGLAMSRCLTDRGLDHVVLERGRVAERWRSERWDSFRLLTPNWQTRLPGHSYRGAESDGFMDRQEIVAFFEHYRRFGGTPLRERTRVCRVERRGSQYVVVTDGESFVTKNVVVATGECGAPAVPGFAKGLSSRVLQLVPSHYKRPEQLPRGGVLVVGASSSGVQLAHELAASGRSVTLAVGRHTRMPRRYRGWDIFTWFDRIGLLDEPVNRARDVRASRASPSLQLAGRADLPWLDLPYLQAQGVRLVGHAVEARGHRMAFAGDLAATASAADQKLRRLLARIDTHVERHGLERFVERPDAVPAFAPRSKATSFDLREERIETVIWATGFRASFPFLQVPVLGPEGEVLHEGGVTPAPGLYFLGLRFMRHRNSSFIDGVGRDAAALADHIEARLVPSSRAA